jgi:6-pyruvoyl-tetrahydropterin synthase
MDIYKSFRFEAAHHLPHLVPVLAGLVSVTVCETCTSGCEYFGPGR